MKSGIYRITCVINGRNYIGQSRDVSSRIWKHKSQLRKGIHENPYLQNAWNLYGEINFSFDFIEKVEIEKLDEREIFYIGFYKSHWTENGFNILKEPMWQDPEAIERKKNRMQQIWKDPIYRQKMMDSVEKQQQNPGYVKRNLVILEEARKCPVKAKKLVLFNEFQKVNEQHKQSQASHAKAGWADEEKRTERIEAIKRAVDTPEEKARKSEQMKLQMQTLEMKAIAKAHNLRQKYDPEYRAKHSQIIKDLWDNDPEYRAKISEASKKKWERPEVKEAHSKGLSEGWQDPERYEKGCKAAKKRWESPEDRQKYIDAMKKRRQDPEYKAAQAAKLKAKWADPEFRAKRMEATRLGKEKKKNEQSIQV